jgi:CBS-domain-containing membrane protein
VLATAKPLANLTAAHLMSRDLVVIPRHLSLRAAAQLLSQARVSGAPVIDPHGRCVGVLSTTDFMHLARDDRGHPGPSPDACVCADWQMVDLDLLPPDSVVGFMTRDPVTAPTTACIRDLARRMLDAHIHRIVIVDENGRPVGIVSSTDVLAAVARLDESC